MTQHTLSDALRRSTAAMVDAHDDVIGALTDLLASTADAVGAAAGGILVRRGDGPVELLVATSHRAADLEVAQLQAHEGPCLEAVERGEPVSERGRDTLVARWPTTGQHVLAAGYVVVHAVPLVWRGTAFGGFNLFWSDAGAEGDDVVAQTSASVDAATMLILSKGPLAPDTLGRSLTRALDDRVVVEQAKGALVHVRSLDPDAAYDALVVMAHDEGTTVGEAARAVLVRARTLA